MVGSTLSEEMVAIAETLRRSTVQIRSGKTGAGSGVIWAADGLIVTNAHVVRDREAEVELADGRVLTATTVTRNTQRDLAVIQVDATNLPIVPIGNSDCLRVGELVLAVGNPLGMVGALTTGIVHTIGVTKRQVWIQADVRLAPGSSGGALANAQGQVIGINAMIVNGRGFAVPSNVVQWFLSHNHDRPYLGITLEAVLLPVGRRPAYGLLITAIEPESPAAAAHLLQGDVLLGVRGRPFQTPNELFHILEHSHAGDGLLLDVLRGGKRLVMEVILHSRDAEQSNAA